MKIFGLAIVRNEIDVIRASILHHAALGLDCILVVDNGSTDGTAEELERLAGEAPLRWSRDDGPFHQAEMITSLAQEARAQGADWVLPFDADEFWYLPHLSLRGLLERTSASVLEGRVLNFVQRRDQMSAAPSALSTMVYRALSLEREYRTDLVEANRVGYVEVAYPPKVLCRTSTDLVFAKGQHSVSGIPGESQESPEIVCLHAPLRSRKSLEEKAMRWLRAKEAGVEGNESWHMHRWHDMGAADALDEEWAANSYSDDGTLDVGGEKHRLVFDPTLQLVVSPWLRRSVADATASFVAAGGSSPSEAVPVSRVDAELVTLAEALVDAKTAAGLRLLEIESANAASVAAVVSDRDRLQASVASLEAVRTLSDEDLLVRMAVVRRIGGWNAVAQRAIRPWLWAPQLLRGMRSPRPTAGE